jgi:hypothetical protein
MSRAGYETYPGDSSDEEENRDKGGDGGGSHVVADTKSAGSNRGGAGKSTRAHSLAQDAKAHTKTNSNSNSKSKPRDDDDFDDFDDDPEDMAELMKNFVAPNSSSHTGTGAGSATSHGSKSAPMPPKKMGTATGYKGSSSGTSSSIRYGAGGIRGIQHQSLQQQQQQRDAQYDQDDASDMNLGEDDQGTVTSSLISTSKIGALGAGNATRLMHIKPGQAIRVKAPSKKSSSHGNSTNSSGISTVNKAFS